MAPSAEGGATSHAPAQDDFPRPPPESNIILPPKEIRTILEKTADYVARNGLRFEDRLREKEANNPRFLFLTDSDPYRAYYDWRISEIKAGRGGNVAAQAGQGAADSGNMPVAQKIKGPDPPEEFQFSARMPNISAQDLDVVRLTALFAAKNGRQFQTALSQREATNYQFDFLRPQHSLYQFFTRLVDQYAELLGARGNESDKVEAKRRTDLRKNIDNRFHVLERAKKRAEWVKYQEQQKARKEQEAEDEKIAYQQIDWHDFVVVETVLFDEADDTAELPAPTTLSDLQSASLEQKAQMSLSRPDMRIEEAFPGEMDGINGGYNPYPQEQQTYTPQPPYQQPYGQPPPPSQLPSQSSPYPPQPSPFSPPPPTAATSANAAFADNTYAQNRLATPQDPAAQARASATAPMNIKPNYQPAARPGFRKSNAPSTSQCPLCSLQIPTAQFEEHMRVELLDPKWKDQRAKQESPMRTTNLSTQDVANNLKRLASQRTDVFDGVSGEMITEEEAARRKRAALSYDGVIPGQHGHGPTGGGAAGGGGGGQQGAGAGQGGGYGGVTASQAQGAVNINEQIRAIQEKHTGR
ncbi:MAG: SF3a splicing factor complex subunit [Chrysothrix sp. TS-e1954]|nr:MAG: SF3a splicing factor complex subunit [Chrysothrix sp. TS-e1954]